MLAFSFTLHAHWQEHFFFSEIQLSTILNNCEIALYRGLETIVIDYLRPKIVGPAVAKLGVALVYGLSAFTLGGLFYFIYSDVGIVNAIKMFWKL